MLPRWNFISPPSFYTELFCIVILSSIVLNLTLSTCSLPLNRGLYEYFFINKNTASPTKARPPAIQPTATPATADLDSPLEPDDDDSDAVDDEVVEDLVDVAVEVAADVATEVAMPSVEGPVTVALKQETLVVKSLSSTKV